MANLLTITADQVGRVLSVTAAADAIKADIRAFNSDTDPARSVLSLQAGELLVMPCERPGLGGVKLATVAEPAAPAATKPAAGRIGGLYLLWETATLTPVAVIDGPALTAVRTAALSLVATRLLAAPGARRAVVFGTGPQGWWHVRAVAALDGIEWIGVVGRRSGSAEALIARAAALGLPAEEARADAVADADIVCAATSSATPLFDGGQLRPEAHVNAVGSHTPDRRELDERTISRATVVAVDTPAAWATAGELAAATAPPAGQARLTLRELVTQPGPARLAEGVTVFKSVGAAYADLAVAAALYHLVAPTAER